MNYERYVNGQIEHVDPMGNIKLFNADATGDVVIDNVIVGSLMGIYAYPNDLPVGTIDSNCAFYTNNLVSVNSNDVNNPNDVEANTLIQGVSRIPSPYILSGTIQFKILGDTTIKIWDDN